MMNQGSQTTGKRRMLATDLDGTLVGHREALASLKEVLSRYRRDWLLVYATGRTLGQAHDLARIEALPEPDIWVTEVGASITYAQDGPDAFWHDRMTAHWDREAVEREAAHWPELTPQPPEANGAFKVPFRIAPDDAARVLPVVEQRLHEAGVPALLVYSSQRDLDIVPAAAGKGRAIDYLLERFAIPLENLLACGDSANDRDMLCLGGPAVAVGNAQDELLLPHLPENVLLARGNCAAGIIEALTHYEWIRPQEGLMIAP